MVKIRSKIAYYRFNPYFKSTLSFIYSNLFLISFSLFLVAYYKKLRYQYFIDSENNNLHLTYFQRALR